MHGILTEHRKFLYAKQPLPTKTPVELRITVLELRLGGLLEATRMNIIPIVVTRVH
jgi:hypothetical protein